MRFLKFITVVSGCIFIAACGEESATQKVVLASLKDPHSAIFGKFTLMVANKLNQKACLTVNSKNLMGGYTGDKQVALTLGSNAKNDGSEWQILSITDRFANEGASHATCVEAIGYSPAEIKEIKEAQKNAFK